MKSREKLNFSRFWQFSGRRFRKEHCSHAKAINDDPQISFWLLYICNNNVTTVIDNEQTIILEDHFRMKQRTVFCNAFSNRKCHLRILILGFIDAVFECVTKLRRSNSWFERTKRISKLNDSNIESDAFSNFAGLAKQNRFSKFSKFSEQSQNFEMTHSVLAQIFSYFRTWLWFTRLCRSSEYL